MIYKTHKDVYRSTAGKMNLDEDIVKTIGDFYWSDISNLIRNFSHREIYINKLGIFRFRKLASINYIKRIPKIEPLLRGGNRSEEVIQLALERASFRKERMEILIKEWDEIVLEYKKHKEDRNAKRDIQEQKANLGGSKE